MEALIVLLGLAILCLPVLTIALLISHLKLKGEVRSLKARTEALARRLSDPSSETPPTATRTPLFDAAPDATPKAGHPANSRTAPTSGQIGQSTVDKSTGDQSTVGKSTGPTNPTPDSQAASTPQPTTTTSATPWRDEPQDPPHPDTAKPQSPTPTSRLTAWLQDNWFYAIAAVSLALAGLFLVQYGVETGMLTPRARVFAALAFGVALIFAGETLRQRANNGNGDNEESATAHLPSTLSSAGLVSVMGGVLAARQLYDLISPETALAALFVCALVGLFLGWRNGPLLAAMGLIGGQSAPFIVGGTSDTPELLLAYFALLTGLGLGIDTLRRWAWVSVLAVVSGMIAGHLLTLSAPTDALLFWRAPFMAGIAALAVLIPARSLRPDHAAPGPLLWHLGPALPRLSPNASQHTPTAAPGFAVWLAAGTTLAASLALLLMHDLPPLAWWSSFASAIALCLALILWSKTGPGLQELALLPASAALLLILQPDFSTNLRAALSDTLALTASQTETRMLPHLSAILALATSISLAAAWRCLQRPTTPKDPANPIWFNSIWAGAAVLFAPLAGLALDLTWHPTTLIGDWPWALHALALACLMTALATRFARVPAPDTTPNTAPNPDPDQPSEQPPNRLLPALATLSALACIAYALTVLLTDAALTLALAATVVAAAALDRRFNLPAMAGFIVAGIIALSYRLVADPGYLHAMDVPFSAMILPYGGATAALLTAHRLLPDRPRTRVFLESGTWAFAGLTASLCIHHGVSALTGDVRAFWEAGIHAAVWITLSLTQLYRLRLGPPLVWFRMVLSGAFGLLGSLAILIGLSLENPLIFGQTVSGLPLINTLAPAYLLPALVLLLGVKRLTNLYRHLRLAIALPGYALAAFWLTMAIRHVWQGGNDMAAPTVSQPELYCYTVALLLIGAGLFGRALQGKGDHLRRAAIAVIALAIAKVFLIDISGLDGLARVFSFLLLGLSLAGLAWLNRWAQMRAPPRP